MVMRLVVLRHGKAVARERWRKDDHLRPLTPAGERQLEAVCRRLKPWVEVEEVWTSPWVRARQTGVVASTIWKVPLREVAWLAGEAMAAIERRRHLPRDRNIAIVGHEPDLGTLVGLLVGGPPLPLRKAGIALLEGDPLETMTLRALLPPKLVLGLNGRG